MNINAQLLIENISTIENIVKEYFNTEIFVMGKRLETILLNKKECFNVRFHQGKLFSISYSDNFKYSTIYTPYNGEKARIYKSKLD